MQKRRFVLLCVAVGLMLLAALVGFGLAKGWQHGVLMSSISALIFLFVLFGGMMAHSTNWRADLSLCIMLATLPAVGVTWGTGALFPFATIVGGVVMAVGFVASMSHGQCLEAAAASFLCVLGSLSILVVTLIGKFEPNALAACALTLLGVVMYCVAVRDSTQTAPFAVAAMIMIAAFPVGALLWSLELPEAVAWIGGGATFLAGAVRAVQLGKQATQAG